MAWLRTLFGAVTNIHVGPLDLSLPRWSTIDWASLAFSTAACMAMLRFGIGMLWVLAGCLALGMAGSLAMR